MREAITFLSLVPVDSFIFLLLAVRCMHVSNSFDTETSQRLLWSSDIYNRSAVSMNTANCGFRLYALVSIKQIKYLY